MVTGIVPHVGGPISMGFPTVMIGFMPAARSTDMAVCVGPPDVIAKGSPTVIVGSLLAARMGDLTAHGGSIVMGCPTVMIGDGAAGAGFGPGPLSPAAAQAAFLILAANKDIPFDYPVDCCFSRAHEMCRMLERTGIKSGKKWLYNRDFPSGSDLAPKDKSGNPVKFYDVRTGTREPVTWRYHVAPTVEVRKPDGTVEKQVLDPSLSDRPLTEDEWLAIQGNPPGSYSRPTDSKPYFHDPRPGRTDEEDPTGDKTKRQLAAHRATRNAALAAERASGSPP